MEEKEISMLITNEVMKPDQVTKLMMKNHSDLKDVVNEIVSELDQSPMEIPTVLLRS